MVTHRGIPAKHQALQATHAAIELTKSIQVGNPSLVHVTCRDGPELIKIRDALEENGIQTHFFWETYEHYFGINAISCLLTPCQRHLLSHLPLWKP
jgi:hypothetical protein